MKILATMVENLDLELSYRSERRSMQTWYGCNNRTIRSCCDCEALSNDFSQVREGGASSNLEQLEEFCEGPIRWVENA